MYALSIARADLFAQLVSQRDVSFFFDQTLSSGGMSETRFASFRMSSLGSLSLKHDLMVSAREAYTKLGR